MDNQNISGCSVVIKEDCYAFLSSPSEETHSHIKCVDVYSADDDYKLLDGAIRCFVDAKEDSLVVQNTKKTTPRILGRYRFEPAVRITLEDESTEKKWFLYVYHHKGAIMLRTEMENSPLDLI